MPKSSTAPACVPSRPSRSAASSRCRHLRAPRTLPHPNSCCGAMRADAAPSGDRNTLASVSQDRLDRSAAAWPGAVSRHKEQRARLGRDRSCQGAKGVVTGCALTRRLKKRRFASVGQSASVERVICMWASPRVIGVAARARGPVRRNKKPCHSRVSRARLVADAVRRLALRAIRVLSGARLQRPRRAASPPSSGMGGVVALGYGELANPPQSGALSAAGTA
jgi:hypothetical protein